MSPARVALLASLAALALACTAPGALARSNGAVAPVAPRAPSSPALATGAQAGASGGEEPATGAAASGEADPLVSNGLASPSCGGGLGGELSATDRGHCETSGFVAAPAPTGDYGIDVHIDTGVLGLSYGGLLSGVQDLFVTPLWMALVWVVHALIVMLEWSFEIDLLDSPAAGGIARGLREAQASFTQPWLALALAVASVLALYHGLIRRRVAETLGEALMMGAMMAGGIWVIADPTGTVGALGRWANQAALGTLAVAARGTPSAPGQALGTSLDSVFAAAIEAPWCYLEFGDVSWCRDPARLDPSLRAAGLALVAGESGTGGGRGLVHSAQLLRNARSNGAIFLAFPANGPQRNSINDERSLLRVLCQSSQATSCRGATAAQAQFRTGGSTWARVGGLLLIAAGLLGMLMLLGFLAVRLLAAAIFSLLYLLLAPAMVLAPAFGEGGRALFRRWAAQLLGAVVSKLLFSFLLGATLAVLTIVSELSAVGWWTQWLLMSTLWWGAYLRRHQALGVLGGAVGQERGRPRSVVRRVGDVLETRKAHAAVRWVKSRHERPAPSVQERVPSSARTPKASPSSPDIQATTMLDREHRDGSARTRRAGESERTTTALGTRLQRVRVERAKALAGGDWRRAVGLEQRGRRIEGELERERTALLGAQTVSSMSREQYVHEHGEERERFLDAQAQLPSSSTRLRASAASSGKRAERRDYARLAPLAGYAGEEYERLDPRAQRSARLEIDRQLARRMELKRDTGGVQGASMEADRPRRTQPPPATGAARRRAPAAEPIDPGGMAARARESSAMRDAREVAAGRKRQLGRGRP